MFALQESTAARTSSLRRGRDIRAVAEKCVLGSQMWRRAFHPFGRFAPADVSLCPPPARRASFFRGSGRITSRYYSIFRDDFRLTT